jgi:alpha-tubulin suppressor-like RCC1 family protein
MYVFVYIYVMPHDECGASAGHNIFGQLGVKDPASRSVFTPILELQDKNIVVVACGDDHSAAVSASGELYLWGRGDCGQLGQGDDRSRNTPTMLPQASVVHPNVTLRRRDPPPATPPRKRARRGSCPDTILA